MSRRLSVRDRKSLWGRSAGRCAYPDCEEELALKANDHDGPTILGEEAHIFAHSTSGPRPNPEGITERSNHYENRILLCPNHHTLVDKRPNTYSVQVLLEWKARWEREVENRFPRQEFGSKELQEIVRRLASNTSVPPAEDFDVIPVDEKILRNRLPAVTQRHIAMGLVRAPEVHAHLLDLAKTVEDYPQLLLTPLLSRYRQLVKDGTQPEDSFEDLRLHASGNSTDFALQTAALAVVVYFFHTCDLFEK